MDKDVVPGLIPIGIYEKVYNNSYIAFDLFAQQYGYITAATVLPLNIGGIYTKLNPEEEQKLYAIEDIPEFSVAMKELHRWADNGWIDFMTPQLIPDDVSKYASMVVHTLDYIKNDANLFFGNNRIIRDASNYTMYVLYPDSTPHPWNDIIQNDYCAVVSKDCKNPEAFFWFLDWLIESQENYDLFHYGLLDPDGVKDGEVDISRVEGDKASAYWNALDCFTISDFQKASPLAPSNWESIYDITPKISVPILEVFAQNYDDAVKLSSEFIDVNKVPQREHDYIDFFLKDIGNISKDSDERIEDFIFKQKEAGKGADLADGFYRMYEELLQ